MYVPLAKELIEVRHYFNNVTDVVVTEVLDIVFFALEGEDPDPIDGCRVFVRRREIAELIAGRMDWLIDRPTNCDLGYAPAATFTLALPPEEVRETLQALLKDEKIYKNGEWINTDEPPEP